ncbi:MAG: L,D-transpeptidase family protein [Alphaproteobacteria bacterium]
MLRLGFALKGAGAAVLVANLFACASYQATKQTGQIADRVVVDKSARTMQLLQNGKVLRSYRVQLGMNPVGHKQAQGDQRTPEGVYAVDLRRPESRFGLALRVSYPSPADRQYAASRGVDPGGEIYIHGQPHGGINPARLANGPDWTDGCVAVSNAEMSEVWGMVRLGTQVEIRP